MKSKLLTIAALITLSSSAYVVPLSDAQAYTGLQNAAACAAAQKERKNCVQKCDAANQHSGHAAQECIEKYCPKKPKNCPFAGIDLRFLEDADDSPVFPPSYEDRQSAPTGR